MRNNNLIKELQRLLPESVSYGGFWIYRHRGTHVNSSVNKPGKLNAQAIIICSKGEMEITCNFRKFTLTENTVFISQPHNTLSLDVTENFDGYIMATVEQELSQYTIANGELAWSGIGQGRLLVTPLHMCMVASAIANEGVMMERHALVPDIDQVVAGIILVAGVRDNA